MKKRLLHLFAGALSAIMLLPGIGMIQAQAEEFVELSVPAGMGFLVSII